MTVTMPEENKAEFELPPAGTYTATCYRVIDLGTQLVEYAGERKQQHKIMVSWELTDEKMTDGRPFTMHQRYTLSSSEKAILRKHLEAWRGVPFTKEELGSFDIGKLISKSCLLQIIHNTKGDKTYANIAAVMRLAKGMTASPLVNETVYFDLTDFKAPEFEKLSESVRAIIAKSPEYQRLKGAHHAEDSIPDEQSNNEPAAHVMEEIPF